VKLAAILRFAAAGWVAGALALVTLSFVWPAIFPGIVNYNHYYSTGIGPSLPLIVLIDLAAASLPAIIGGILGGQIPKEGGQRQQLLMAGIFGIILALPCGCFGLWLFSSY
jgi:hypothetical protein